MTWIKSAVLVAVALACLLAVSMAPASVPVVEPQAVTVVPMMSNAACPGPQQLPVGDLGTSGDLAAGTQDREMTVWGEGASFPVGLGQAWAAPLATVFERINDGDLESIAAVTCLTASADTWLVGGSTVIGNSSRLVLSNPSDVAVEVIVTLYGPLGEVGDPLTIAVAPRGQEDRLLEGTASGLTAMAVHLEASGPGIVAVLQDSRLEGFHPAGSDWVGATDPVERVVIPSVGSEAEGATSVLRLFAPDGATVTATLVTDSGVQSWSSVRGLTLDAGVVTDVPVPLTGTGAVEIVADAPVLAAVLTVVPRAADEGLAGAQSYDLQWVPGVADVSTGSRAVIVPAEEAVLAVYAESVTSAVFTDAAGTVVETVNIPARSVRRVPLSVAAGTTLVTDAAVAWVVEVATVEGYVTSVAPAPIGQEDRVVQVRPAPFAPVVP